MLLAAIVSACSGEPPLTNTEFVYCMDKIPALELDNIGVQALGLPAGWILRVAPNTDRANPDFISACHVAFAVK